MTNRGLDLTFLGAAGTVTGSRHLLTGVGPPVLVDCGLFQGFKQLRLRNRGPFAMPPADLGGIVLTHAHLDHSGYLPVLVRDGYHGKVSATAATSDLCGILLPDSGHLQEEEAERANRYGYSRHHPALPLYTRADAERALGQLTPVPWDRDHRVADLTCRFRRAGHILGAATVTLSDGRTTVLFSGDLGRPHDALMYPPAPVTHADYLVLESTYGDRDHPAGDPWEPFAAAIRRTTARGGVVVIPAFAVGRAQSVLHHLHVLRERGDLPEVPIFLNSPMAADATALYQIHHGDHRLSAAECGAAFGAARITRTVEESKAIDARIGPMIIISASGMATGGRVLFHLERFGGDHRNTILLVGYQAGGTRGDALRRGARELKIHGRRVPIRAEVVALDGLSAHADRREILEWLRGFETAPRRTFITHGEPRASDALRQLIEEELKWTVEVPEHGQQVRLG